MIKGVTKEDTRWRATKRGWALSDNQGIGTLFKRNHPITVRDEDALHIIAGKDQTQARRPEKRQPKARGKQAGTPVNKQAVVELDKIVEGGIPPVNKG